MAQIYPPYALDPRSVPAQQQYGLARETETLQILRGALPDSYIIFHSTHIAWMDGTRFKEREADYLIMTTAGQLLMVEQKTGALEETAAGLHKSYGTAAPKSVVTQCHEALDGLRESFRTAYGRDAKLEVRFVLYCPDHVVRDIAAAGIAAEQIVDARRRRALPRAIRDLLPERAADPVQSERVRRMLTQSVRFSPDLGVRAAEGEKLVERLTGDLLDFLTGLEMAPFWLRIDGTAGCGKTQMIARFAERARAEGKRCLTVCFNRLLADELRESLPPEVSVDTLHGVARRMLEDAGHPPDMSGASNPRFWQDLVSAATDVALMTESRDWLFDALVVDEGQDLHQDGFELLKLLLKPGADVVWLQDEGQRLYGGRPFAAPGFVGFRCRDNYRSPRRIARFIKALLGTDFEVRNPLQGDAVLVIDATAEGLLTRLGERVNKLVADGYALDQIVILTGHGIAASAVIKADRIGGHPTRRPVGYTPEGDTLFSDGALRVETLWRFKGNQAQAVLVCELDGDLKNNFVRNRLYVAATRATAHLEWFLPRTSALAQELRRAAGQSVEER
jgi:AAA domain/UvrD-like helicase C-terminal domain